MVIKRYDKGCKFLSTKKCSFLHYTINHRFFGIPPFSVNFPHPSGLTVVVDRRENAIIVTQNPYSARTRAVEGEMIKFSDVFIIEGKDTIGSGFEVVSTYTDARVTLLIDRCEYAVVV